MKKKVFIVLGSPRRDGNSTILAEEVARGAIEQGADVNVIYLNGMDIQPCQGCETCLTEGSCIIQDDMQSLYPTLREVDSIIIASPVYFFNLSAQVKTFIDRWFSVAVGDRNIFKGKKTALILTYADPDPFSSGAVNALRSFQDVCNYLGANIIGMIYGKASGMGEIRQNKELMDKAYSLGKNL